MNAVALTPVELLEFLLSVAPVRPVFIKGPPGGGKTSIVQRFCNSVGLDCVTLHGSTCLPEDVVGLPIPDHDEKVTRYYPPARLARKEAYCLFLDEFPNASREVQKAFYSLVHDKRTDSFEMPEGSIVILGGNRQQDQAFVNPVSAALINRVVSIELEDSPKAFLAWARENGLHPLIIEYLDTRPDHMRGTPGNSGDSFSSQRSWHMFSDGLLALGEQPEERLAKALAYGTLSPSHATSFLAFLKLKLRKNDIERLFKGTVKWPAKPEERDILVFMADAFRLHLARELPDDASDIKEKSREIAHQAKALLRDLAHISMEIAQRALYSSEDSRPLPAWFLAEIVRDLPRLARQDN